MLKAIAVSSLIYVGVHLSLVVLGTLITWTLHVIDWSMDRWGRGG